MKWWPKREPKVTIAFTAEEISLLMNAAALGVAVVTGELNVAEKAIPVAAESFWIVGDESWNALGERVAKAVEAALPEVFDIETIRGRAA